jgi:hypothetical protein
MTLPVPTWTRNLQADGWVNIHDIIVQPPRLTAVDAFMGDPNAETLVLGKDSAPASLFAALARERSPDPYRHDSTLPTNRMLHAILAHVGVDAPLDGSKARTCGVYYANAYWLLRGDGRFSGALPNPEQARAQSARVLAYILNSLPRLRRIIAMGKDAFAALMQFYNLDADWRRNLVERRAISADGIRIHASSHLGHFGVRMRLPRATPEQRIAAIQADWIAAFDA